VGDVVVHFVLQQLHIFVEGTAVIFSTASQKKQQLFWPKLAVELVFVSERQAAESRIFDESLLPELTHHSTGVLV
jgi:hypothetical protein